MQRENRILTSEDVLGAKAVLVQVYADENYPMFLELESKQVERLKSIDSDSTTRIKNWAFQVNLKDGGSTEMKELPAKELVDDSEEYGGYVIIIGQA